MRIKIKKEMTLSELIEWARENPELSRGKKFFETRFSDAFVYFQSTTDRYLSFGYVSIDASFIVEVEEEITEETKFDRLFKVFEPIEGAYESLSYANTSIKECLYGRRVPTKAFYILNDDMTMTLIWKDGELVV
ncbi:hypothetical protein L4932_03500 [Staphylococcus aureus]|uniref:hypothetical protein n=1 Tax=Staphylococcus aureus TaxID=1280 RepID=UPI000BBBB1C8|nr:hypothetical protein [Staphylococcus aureus]MBS7752671.1 hypothetical protein [Staphylococcus aureus]MBS7760407.1 hypothetical protein [Staphylococcus aureus]MDN4117295.1 hypothetical protein [Staphylococcus aureus]MDN4124261.1 hypothetical protein [Staphylococcus aureus]MVW52086.1 hypothetical protein [Staphylococcus aureus]